MVRINLLAAKAGLCKGCSCELIAKSPKTGFTTLAPCVTDAYLIEGGRAIYSIGGRPFQKLRQLSQTTHSTVAKINRKRVIPTGDLYSTDLSFSTSGRQFAASKPEAFVPTESNSMGGTLLPRYGKGKDGIWRP